MRQDEKRPARAAARMAAALFVTAVLTGCGDGTAAAPPAPPLPPEVAAIADRLEAESPAERIAAVKLLAKCKAPEAVRVLAGVLADDSPDVRCWAVWALGKKSDIKAVVKVVRALDDTNPSVRCAAVEALGSVKDVKAVGHVANRLVDANTAVRLAASIQLAEKIDVELLKEEEARIVPLAVGLLSEPNLPVSANAVMILQRISGENYGSTLDWLAASPSKRKAVIDQWREWANQRQTNP